MKNIKNIFASLLLTALFATPVIADAAAFRTNQIIDPVTQGWLHSNGVGTSTITASTSPTVNYITATSSTATSTFAHGVQATGGYFSSFIRVVNDLVTDITGFGLAISGGALGIDTTGASDEECLTYEETGPAIEWQACSGSLALDDLSDVVITSAAYGDFLMYNGTNWVDTATSTIFGQNLTSAGSPTFVDATLTNDLLLSSGSIINWNSGDITLTHSSNRLFLTGGELRFDNNTVLKFKNTTDNDAGLIYTNTSNEFLIHSESLAYPIFMDGSTLNFGNNGGTGNINFGASGARAIFTSSGAVFNDGGGNLDFRIEGDNITDLFFLDASADRIGISTTTPSGLFSIEQGTEIFSLIVGNTGSTTPSFSILGVNGDGRVGVSTSTPFTKFALGSGAFTTAAYTKATTTSMTIDWREGNFQTVRIGTAGVTIAHTGYIPAQTLTVEVCNPNASASTVAWTGVFWPGGTPPTHTTTANVCDLYVFRAGAGTSTPIIYGGFNQNYGI